MLWGAFHFPRRSRQTNRFTPHPDPLPFEGRESAMGADVMADAIAARGEQRISIMCRACSEALTR